MAKELTTTERRERYEKLVESAERMIRENPSGYRRRLALLALLGYAVVFGVLFLLLALIAGSVIAALASSVVMLFLVKMKLIFVLPVLAWVLCRALWVRFERPSGRRVSRDDAPALHEQLDSLRAALDVPDIDEILLTDDFNAAVAQTPRLGVLGWQRNSLLVGVPLLLAMSPEEARSVLAHELGHLSRNHSRFGGWIYRVRETWYRIMHALDESHGWGIGWLRKFFDWYAPYFNAMSFALARANEYDADAVAVTLTSKTAMTSALVGSTIRDQIANDDYWSALIDRANHEPEPEPRPYRGLMRFHETHAPEQEHLDRTATRAMAVETDYSDTHPALRERISAIGEPPVPTFRIPFSAAHAWLGGTLAKVLDEIDAAWLENNGESWRARFQEQCEQRAQLAALRERAKDDLDSLELWQLASLTEQHDGAETALEIYREYQQREPEDRDADYVIGRILLDKGDATGIDAMERACDTFGLRLSACEYLYGFFSRNDDSDRATHWRQRGEAQIDLENRARAERSFVAMGDTFQPSELDSAAIQSLTDQLARRDEVKHAWIACKNVEVAPESPLYVLAVEKRGTFRDYTKLVNSLAAELEFPGETFVVPAGGDGKDVARKVKKFGEPLL